MESVTDEYGDAVLTETTAYLSAVRECVALLPTALDAYGTDEFGPTVERICEHESACDERLREIRGLLGDLAPPNYTEVYLRTGEVMQLYALVDEVPNAAEGFVRQLDVVEPTLPPDVRSEFDAMATATVDATDALADAVEGYVTDLVTPGEKDDVTPAVERVSGFESDCDGRVQAAVETAFATEATADALVVRDLSASLDAAADAAEDAADHLLFMQGADV